MYKHILLAVDLSSVTPTVAKRAHELAKKFHAKLSIMHVFEYVPIVYSGVESFMPMDAELMEIYEKQSQQELLRIAKKLHIPKNRCYIEFGSIKHAVTEKAKKIKADLLIVGSHGHHGPALLLGSSASAILHSVKCDVLAVRV